MAIIEVSHASLQTVLHQAIIMEGLTNVVPSASINRMVEGILNYYTDLAGRVVLLEQMNKAEELRQVELPTITALSATSVSSTRPVQPVAYAIKDMMTNRLVYQFLVSPTEKEARRLKSEYFPTTQYRVVALIEKVTK